MAFDKPTRNRLASFVGKARDLIAGEFTQQFQSLYGISDKGTITPLEQLGHLDDAELATAALLRERIDYFIKTHPEDREGSKAAVARLAREQAFTILNRLAAIRMAEKRDLIVESVGKGYQSKGFKVFEQVAGAGLGDTYNRYRRYFFCLCDELAMDLGVLFDRRSPQGLLFPRETALQDFFTLLNAPELDPLWAEDETIGWIYQYYNDPAERKKMRDESAAPRNSRELAVRNQFFTPRYVVEFLTDNTLGRIWYEMTQGKTGLKDQCRYLVRRPTEIFLKPGEVTPETMSPEGLSQEELLKQPVYIPYRTIKDPREIGMLDPACGSMHAGLYAFDLFESIYEEAWELDLKSLRREYPEKEGFLREVPRLIIEHNIHGIDIDPRATQIAGLSLWLRAQKSWQVQHVPAAQRPRIMRSNIVCAEPMPGSPELLKEFTANLHPPLLGQMMEKVFARMQLAGEAGSLLKIEEDISDLVKEAKKSWNTPRKAEQMELSLGLKAKPKQGELPLDVSGISDELFWETAEESIYAALRAYAEQAESGGYQRRLFAEDAARGFAFIDLCRKRYDVLVMNPPYGEASDRMAKYLKARYAEGSSDVFLPFVERAIAFGARGGQCGALTSRNFMFNQRMADFRKDLLLSKGALSLLADLGNNVLDAAVDVAAFTVSKETNRQSSSKQSLFFDVVNSGDRPTDLLESITAISSGVCKSGIFHRSLAFFRSLPDCRISYSAPDSMVQLFSHCQKLAPVHGLVLKGLITGDDERYVRAWQECPMGDDGSRWRRFHKGGDYSPFFSDVDLMINWGKDGAELKADAERKYGSASRTIKNEVYFGKPGLAWGVNNSVGFAVKVVPSGCVFADIGPNFQPTDARQLFLWAGFLNSFTVKMILRLFQSGDRGRFMWIANIIEQIPCPPDVALDRCAEPSRRATLVFLKESLHDERSPLFTRPAPELCGDAEDLKSACDRNLNYLQNMARELKELSSIIDDVVATAFNQSFPDADGIRSLITEQEQPWKSYLSKFREKLNSQTANVISYAVGCAVGRWNICFATGVHQAPELPDPFAPLPVCPPGMLQNADGLPAEPKNVPADYPLRISWPGIIVDDENHPEDIIARTREALELIWQERAEAIEQEACELLGVKTLRDYFHRPAGFFADHLKRYSKSRRQAAIYWPLSTAKGSYTLWIYYHRLTDQTLHTALADFVDPKLKAVRAEIGSLRGTGKDCNRLEELLDLEKELADFCAEIEGIIKLPWKPNLNDGVIITASPLWKLFRLPKWQKDLKACWEKLEKGEYDWAHLAYSIWPKRVEEVCKKDRSIAIAHNLEHLCQMMPPKAKGKRGK